ncbi:MULTISPECIES: TRAP transporter substrate-binding protein [Thalassospira]|jgi:tripartite ATP-independent transporter DctP family solute receptor|nr:MULTISPECIES: TRAP transporter substrate-binding protein [Thalassospira]MBL4842392.1 TRAP transporter substrate-binding protein [Thalassospira sp.]MCD1596343.1 TRAP transporter substrate-binding protein [Thalassospira xiamenensis]OCK09918.1 TRAP dicarboxylate transporter, DctP subunit [Thalassospira sp. KO164]PXX28023.1 tripartite ATP-independent transporter DctP family solute receptor [Thalassospira sp. 11-3]QPL34412.1 TRAP transporter substrate-binding protein [Thalassospira sp. B30-1]|tara:strand:- start:720 stop:1718 length:999 start_codon:yes stop_codon:yes gene_type:complete
MTHTGRIRKFVAAVTFGSITSMSALATANAADEIVFAISAEHGSLQANTAAEFTRLANERLGDKATVKLFDSAQLGKDKELMQRLKLGTVQITLPSSTMPTIADKFALFDLPFLVKDRDQLAKIEESVFWPTVAPQAEEAGYKILALWENGFRQITNNARPINVPADLDGIKLRTPQSEWRVAMFSNYGANPTPMAFSEVFVGLQTGVIDGQENPLTNIEAAKLNEVQKYLTLSGHIYSPSYPTMSVTVYNDLDPEVRDILVNTAREVALWSRDAGAKADKALLDELTAGGMEVNTADRAAFVEASKPIYDKFASEIDGGKALVDAALATAD